MGANTRLILVRGARELLTLRGDQRPRRGPALKELGIIPDGSLLIRDGIIVQVGSTRRIENLAAARGAIEINAAGRVVMPGFVDSHTHLLFPPPSSPAAREEAARATRNNTTRRLHAAARTWLDAMARHGSTTVEAKTGAWPDMVAELKLLRVLLAARRVPIDLVATFLFRVAIDQPPEQVDRLFRDFLPALRRRGLIHFAGLAWEEHPAAVRYLETASKLGMPLKIHCPGSGSGAVEAAVRFQAVSVDHLERASARDAALLADSSTVATLLPTAGCLPGRIFPPARMLIDTGAAVAIASGFTPRHSSTWSMQTVIALACIQMRMTPAEAISAATINGAFAVGCAARTGSLEPGKQADLVLLNISDHRELGIYLGANLVRLTMKSGGAIYHEANVIGTEPGAAPDHLG